MRRFCFLQKFPEQKSMKINITRSMSTIHTKYELCICLKGFPIPRCEFYLCGETNKHQRLYAYRNICWMFLLYFEGICFLLWTLSDIAAGQHHWEYNNLYEASKCKRLRCRRKSVSNYFPSPFLNTWYVYACSRLTTNLEHF